MRTRFCLARYWPRGCHPLPFAGKSSSTRCPGQFYRYEFVQYGTNRSLCRGNSYAIHHDGRTRGVARGVLAIFRDTTPEVALWSSHLHTLSCVNSQLSTRGTGVDRSSDKFASRSVGGPKLAARKGNEEFKKCRKLCEDGDICEAVDVLDLLVQGGQHVSSALFHRALKRCFAPQYLGLGRRIHDLTIKSGYEGDAFLATHLMGFYASHGSLEEALGVFAKVPLPDAYNWATIIFAHARHGQPREAIRLYKEMRNSRVKPDNHIFLAVLKACATVSDVAAGKDVHADILSSSGEPDIFVQTGLVDMYAKCNSVEDARKVFDMLPHKNVVTWTAMIAGYAQQGMGQEALTIYNDMQQEGLTPPCPVTFVCLLQACASVGAGGLSPGKQLHGQIKDRGLQNDVVLGGSLVNMYAKCGSIEDARHVFENLQRKNVVTWTAMINGYAQQELGEEALGLYSRMQKEGMAPPNSVTFACLLQACATVGVAALPWGKQLHLQVDERGLLDDAVVASSLVNMYIKCGNIEDARLVFDRLSSKDVVTWNAVIGGYSQQGMAHEALSLYSTMQQGSKTPPDAITFVSVLQACASIGVAAREQGQHLHAQIVKQDLHHDVAVGGSLVNMLAKCGCVLDARRVFDSLAQKNVVTWNALFAGYAQQGMGQEALDLYSSMEQQGMSATPVTFVCLLQACATVAALPLGKQLHAQIEQGGMQGDVVVGAGLVNMYAKCGSMEEAQQVFDALPERNIETWGALIAGYTRQGDSDAVFALLERMRLEGVQPNGITFLSVLAVCSHVGLVDEGRKYFRAMLSDHCISPTVEHYTCMVDLLGRAGHLQEALLLAKNMPCPTDGAVWVTLLSACQKWNNVEIGKQAFQHAVRVNEDDASSYMLMSNIYAGAQMWEEAKAMQVRRRKFNAWKEPGQTWCTDAGGLVHSFAVG